MLPRSPRPSRGRWPTRSASGGCSSSRAWCWPGSWPPTASARPTWSPWCSCSSTASSAYMTDFIPESRRAEGIGYWGMSTMLAVAFAPSVGFSMYRLGWGWLCAEAAILNLGMAAIALTLEETSVAARFTREKFFTRELVEWRVLSVTLWLFLCWFGYGGVTSFVAGYAERNRIAPEGIFFTSFAITVLVTRVFSGRLADRVGHRRFFLPCLALVTVALGMLASARTRGPLVAAAVVFGMGFGNMYPAFVAHVVKFVPDQ